MKSKTLAVCLLAISLSSHAETIEGLIKKHGKSAIMGIISKKIHNEFTISVNGALSKAYTPNEDFITAATLSIDLTRAGMTVDDIEESFQERVIERKLEEKRIAEETKARQESDERRRQQARRREEEDKTFWENASEAEKQQFNRAIANGNRAPSANKSPTVRPSVQPSSAAPITQPSNPRISSANTAFSTDAQVDCQNGIQRMAKYRYNWTDTGFLESKFSRFVWEDDSHRILLAAGDKIEMQNGFGAFQAMIYICKIDVTTGKLLDIILQPGRF